MPRVPYRYGLTVPAPDLPYSILRRWRCWIGQHIWGKPEPFWVFRHTGSDRTTHHVTRACRVCGKVQEMEVFS